jgi:hypothetical protein
VVRGTGAALLAITATLGAAAPGHAQLPAPAVSSPDPIHVGGYAGVVVNTPASPAVERTGVTEGNAALLVSGTVLSRLGWFAELDAVRSSRQNFAGRQDERQLDAARLYAELTISDALRLRIGRFLTPVGAWNESPAEPLTWSAVRPLTTYRSFAKSATGAMLAGDVPIAGHDAGYALYAVGGGGPWPRDHDEVRFSRAVGARAAIELAHGVWLGGSGVVLRQVRPWVADDEGEYGRDSTSEVEGETQDGQAGTEVELDERDDELHDRSTRALVGVDLRVRVLGAELSAEGTQLARLDGERTERGAFAQGVVPVIGPLFAVGRVERFEPRTGAVSTTGAAGMVLRPVARLVLKLERQWTTAPTARTGQGWFASLSLLF